MGRIALSLLLLGAMAPTANAEGIRSLGVTVSPVGAWVATGVHPSSVMIGNGGAVDWDYQRAGSTVSMGGHVAQSVHFTEATPVRIRVGPTLGRVRPFVGAGASLLLPLGKDVRGAPLRLGLEVGGGAELTLTPLLYLAGEGRFQSFSLSTDPFSGERQEVLSAYVGLGFRL